MDTLAALERLTLVCPGLSFWEGVYLPPKLQEIRISTQKTTPPVREWGLQHLTALSRLRTEKGDDILNTLMKESLLPISLGSLLIKDLTFWKCRQLESLPENCLPSSLKSLQLWKCNKLESLPEDSLPSSLKKLSITDCPLLEERYKRKENWSKIAHIPVIDINDEVTI